jgi:Na+-driven multidrug efflux pump
VLRKIILLIPLAIILPHYFGVMGVYYAEPVSDTLSALVATTLFLINIPKILNLKTKKLYHKIV